MANQVKFKYYCSQGCLVFGDCPSHEASCELVPDKYADMVHFKFQDIETRDGNTRRVWFEVFDPNMWRAMLEAYNAEVSRNAELYGGRT